MTDDKVLRPVPQPEAGDEYNPSKDRERVRAGLALSLVVLLAALVLSLVVSIAAGWRTWDELEGVATLTLGPIVGLAGTMLGFYFGQKEQAR